MFCRIAKLSSENVGRAQSAFVLQVVQRTMWGKSREKKAARMYHTRNFGTGLVEADEYYLSRVGLRGRKRWLLLCGLLCAYLIVVGHLVVSLPTCNMYAAPYNLEG